MIPADRPAQPTRLTRTCEPTEPTGLAESSTLARSAKSCEPTGPSFGPTRSRRAYAAFTLLEVVVVAALLALLGAGAAAAIASARRADAAAAELARRGQLRAAAEAILAGEVSQAGRHPPDAAPVGEPPFSGLPPLEILLATGAGDGVLVRYHDLRFREGPTEVEASFEAGRDGRGRFNLYRRAGAGVRQPALEEVVALEVAALYQIDGRAPPLPGSYRDVTGLELTITFAWGERAALVIAFDDGLEALVR